MNTHVRVTKMAMTGLVCLACFLFAQPTATVLTTLRQEHPRLFIGKGDMARIKELAAIDTFYNQLVQVVLQEAERNLADPVIIHQKRGKRLLGQTRNALSRISHLAMAYRLTGEKKYLARAEQEMLAAAALPDWNPSHFLDAAEMATGMAIGYDWLYRDLSQASRLKIRTALVEKALKPGFTEPAPWWVAVGHNWNQVCHTGLALAGLAMAEDEPQWAQRAVDRALKFVPHAMKESYQPDGVYTEGPSYWNYGTTYNVLLIDALDSALGNDFGLGQAPGFKESAIYRLLVVGSDGDFFRYSDCGGRGESAPCLYWFARKFKQPEITWFSRESEWEIINKMLQKKQGGERLFPLSLLWYEPAEQPQQQLPLNYLGRSANPIALFRSSWDQEEALWLAVKGGNNENNHNHMDAGTFVIIAGNIRWSQDLGMDNYYALEQLPPDLWGEGRYQFFRLGVQGHSTLWINQAEMALSNSTSPIIAFFNSPQRAHAVIDLSKPWREQAEKVMRGTAMLHKRSFLIQDEITAASGEILWQMITIDAIEIERSAAVMLKDGKRFHAQILMPGGAVFEVLPVKPVYAEENQNDGYAKLAIRLKPGGSTQTVTIAVHMWLEGADIVDAPEIIPLAQWSDNKIKD